MKNERLVTGYIFNRGLLTTLCFLLFKLTINAQSYTVAIEWDANRVVWENGEQISVPVIKRNDYQNGVPFFSWKQKAKSGNFSLTYSEVHSEPAPSVDLQLLNRRNVEIPGSPSISLQVVKSRNEYAFVASAFPYYMENGSVRRITGFQVSAEMLPFSAQVRAKDYVDHSVLASGDWYKISVDRDGVFKLDKAFLRSCGIDVESLNPQHLNIYGNAAGRLPEKNNGVFYDDLTKTAIQVVGDADGKFDEGDYVLFYGAGPNRWDYFSGSGFERNQHIYSETYCYFIHVSASDAPLRVQPVALASGSATHTVTSYDYYDIHELETRSLVGGGQRWYGELFDGELSQTVSFSTPDLVSGTSATFQYAVASNATSGGNSFRFLYNGNIVGTQSMSTGGGDYARNTGSFNVSSPGSTVPLTVVFNRVNASVKGYLDYIELSARRSLRLTGSQFQFRDVVSAGTGNVSDFIVTGVSGANRIWEVTNKRQPGSVNATLNGSQLEFRVNTDSLREFIVFGDAFYSPKVLGKVVNQDLHGLDFADYLIVTHPDFVSQAERLAGLHEALGTSTHVVTTSQIYNEFSSGVQDATAIRRFVKMFYDRAAGNTDLQPKYLLLFGDATYDPKNRVGNNNYMVPTYEVLNSENHISAMVTDDYFGLLDDNESINGADGMDVAVGRLLITTQDDAVSQVNKIEHYMKNGSDLFSGGPNTCCTGKDNSTFGDWRLNYSIVTDDEEGGYFVNTDAEPVVQEVQGLYPTMNYDKIYSDAYVQVSTAGGQRYPDVLNAITDRVERGSLVMNYIGHGGEVGAAEERFITIPQIQSWTNIDKLAFFVTATCEFTKFDDPARVSAGEWISLNTGGGAIALATTTRSVYFGVNTQTIATFYEYVFSRDAANQPLTFGEIMRLTKNNSGTSDNRRSFNLIGDPALKIALPQYTVVTDSINGINPLLVSDTVRALSKMRIKGHLVDQNGNIMSNFNGVLSPTIFDKSKTNHTLGNDADSPVIDFRTQSNALYKGKASVTNGYFSFEFVVPKDINYAFGHGKISYYANSTYTDASGLDTNFIVGGIDVNALVDTQGPEIEMYLNDDKFVNGGITSQEPLLIVNCSDENGINTVGNGVGHDLVAILDGNTSEPILLNQYYTGNLDSYKTGQIQYTLKNLSVGKHTLEVKIWDVNNNSSVATIEFTVVEDEDVQIDHVLNYPNPFSTKTTFYFEHNQSCSSLEAQIAIYTVSGRLVKTINKQVSTSGFRAEGIEWDGKDDFGDQLAKGVYVYRLSVALPDGGKAEKLEKLVLLK